jgi:hypothetical protein
MEGREQESGMLHLPQAQICLRAKIPNGLYKG